MAKVHPITTNTGTNSHTSLQILPFQHRIYGSRYRFLVPYSRSITKSLTLEKPYPISRRITNEIKMGFCIMGSVAHPQLLCKSCYTTRAHTNWRCGKRSAAGRMKLGDLGSSNKGVVMCGFDPVEFEERNSPKEVKKEIEKCYNLIHKLGRGVVYLGSSRFSADHPHYQQAMELGSEVAKLLNCTTWSGAGPGLMDAVTKGALAANKPVGGFKIGKEAGEWTASNFHPYLPPEAYLTCRFFSARKHGLVDAVVRNNSSVKTAVIALPGGVGTLDEVFEILALIQLERIGSELPVPFLLMNYDSFYSKLLDFMEDCKQWGVVADGEVEGLWKICNRNSEALEYLAKFYGLPQIGRTIGREHEVVS